MINRFLKLHNNPKVYLCLTALVVDESNNKSTVD